MEKLLPEKAVDILQKHGTIITVEQAKIILDFLYQLSDIVVAQYLRKYAVDKEITKPTGQDTKIISIFE